MKSDLAYLVLICTKSSIKLQIPFTQILFVLQILFDLSIICNADNKTQSLKLSEPFCKVIYIINSGEAKYYHWIFFLVPPQHYDKDQYLYGGMISRCIGQFRTVLTLVY